MKKKKCTNSCKSCIIFETNCVGSINSSGCSKSLPIFLAQNAHNDVNMKNCSPGFVEFKK